MPAHTGQEYVTGIKERPREVWIDGERVDYERVFGGTPVRNAMTLFNAYDKKPSRQRVRGFLESGD